MCSYALQGSQLPALRKAAECHCERLSGHLDAEHSYNLLVRQDVRLQKEQDRE